MNAILITACALSTMCEEGMDLPGPRHHEASTIVIMQELVTYIAGITFSCLLLLSQSWSMPSSIVLSTIGGYKNVQIDTVIR